MSRDVALEAIGPDTDADHRMVDGMIAGLIAASRGRHLVAKP
jgi:hypothetical protein